MPGTGEFNERFLKARKAIWFDSQNNDFDIMHVYNTEGRQYEGASNRHTLKVEGTVVAKFSRAELAFTKQEAEERLAKMLTKIAKSGERLIKKAFH